MKSTQLVLNFNFWVVIPSSNLISSEEKCVKNQKFCFETMDLNFVFKEEKERENSQVCNWTECNVEPNFYPRSP